MRTRSIPGFHRGYGPMRRWIRRDAEEVLSDDRARNRAGHHFLLGGAHDHAGLEFKPGKSEQD